MQCNIQLHSKLLIFSVFTQAFSLFSFSSCTVKVKDMRLKWEWREFKCFKKKKSFLDQLCARDRFKFGGSERRFILTLWFQQRSLAFSSNSSCLSLPFRLLGIRFLFNPITLKTLLTVNIGDWNFSSSIPFTGYWEFVFPEKVLLGILWVDKH